MNERRQAIIRMVLVLGIIIFINMISVRFFMRFDLTENGMYTLSDASKNLMRTLDDKFLVKAYFTAELPPPYNNNRRYLQDQLDEYRAYAGGRLQYEFIDPGKKEELEQEAQKYGIPPVQVQVLREDKLQIEKAYMGLVFLYGDKQEQLPVMQSTANLEYEISSAIKKMSSKELKKVGFLAGHGEPPLQQLSKLQEVLGKQYEIAAVSLAGGRPIPPDIATLVIVAPREELKSWELFLIDQYLMTGGKIAFFINKVDASLQMQAGRPLNTGLENILESYGVRINTDLVRDVNCAYITVSQQTGFFVLQNQVPFHYLPRIGEFNTTSPVVKDLNALVFFFISSIDTTPAAQNGLIANVLVSSSRRSGRQENFFVINPTAPVTREMFTEAGIPLAVSVEGSFPSAFRNRPVGADSTVTASFDSTNKLGSGIASKIVVVGDGDFLQDQMSGGNRDNILFASNIIDWLADDIGLASIRSRNNESKPLDDVPEGTKTIVKGINMALPALLVVFVGIFRWRWRVGMRKRLESRGM